MNYQIAIIFEKVSSSLLDSLSDDSQDMKIIACEVLDYLFIHYSTVFELRHSVCFSSALLKRVDDENQKVRIKACHCLSSCVQMWKLQHKLDHSHTLNLFKSLLLYLDDPDDEFQQTVLSEY